MTGALRARGRPRSATALSPAERKRRYRAKAALEAAILRAVAEGVDLGATILEVLRSSDRRKKDASSQASGELARLHGERPISVSQIPGTKSPVQWWQATEYPHDSDLVACEARVCAGEVRFFSPCQDVDPKLVRALSRSLSGKEARSGPRWTQVGSADAAVLEADFTADGEVSAIVHLSRGL